MDIKAMASSTLPVTASAAAANQNVKPQTASNVQAAPKKTEQKHSSKLPYVAGTIVLAGLGIYFGRNHISKLFKEKEIIKKEIENELGELGQNLKSDLKYPPYTQKFMHLKKAQEGPVYKMPEIIAESVRTEPVKISITPVKKGSVLKEAQKFDKHASDIEDVVPLAEEALEKTPVKTVIKEAAQKVETPEAENIIKETNAAPVKLVEAKAQAIQPAVEETANNLGNNAGKYKEICVGFDENKKPIFEKIPVYEAEELAPIKDVYLEAKNALNLNDKEILAKIVNNKTSQASEIDRIITENIVKEHVNLPMMNKIAGDFARDVKGRGENRYHQAADILEQSYIREFIKGDVKQKEGLQNFFDFAKNDSPLFEIYSHMPIDEAASRLRCLADNDLKSASYKGMNAETFFDKALNRLVEKLQFQKYNEAKGIKSGF